MTSRIRVHARPNPWPRAGGQRNAVSLRAPHRRRAELAIADPRADADVHRQALIWRWLAFSVGLPKEASIATQGAGRRTHHPTGGPVLASTAEDGGAGRRGCGQTDPWRCRPRDRRARARFSTSKGMPRRTGAQRSAKGASPMRPRPCSRAGRAASALVARSLAGPAQPVGSASRRAWRGVAAIGTDWFAGRRRWPGRSGRPA